MLSVGGLFMLQKEQVTVMNYSVAYWTIMLSLYHDVVPYIHTASTVFLRKYFAQNENYFQAEK